MTIKLYSYHAKFTLELCQRACIFPPEGIVIYLCLLFSAPALHLTLFQAHGQGFSTTHRVISTCISFIPSQAVRFTSGTWNLIFIYLYKYSAYLKQPFFYQLCLVHISPSCWFLTLILVVQCFILQIKSLKIYE